VGRTLWDSWIGRSVLGAPLDRGIVEHYLIGKAQWLEHYGIVGQVSG